MVEVEVVQVSRLIAFLSSMSGFFLLVASCANFYLAVKASKKSSTVVTTNIVYEVHSVSNLAPSVNSAILEQINSSTNAPKEVAQYPYQYFIAHRRIGAWMFGRPYYDGSLCSYGRIDKIFPDRILLISGDWITNRTPSPVVDSSHSVAKEISRRDRR